MATGNGRLKALGKVAQYIFYAVVGFFGVTNLGPTWVGAGYAVVAVPFYNLFCLTPGASSFSSALVGAPPSVTGYQLFLQDAGCSVGDLERQTQSSAGTGTTYDNEKIFWTNDAIGNLFHNIGQLMARNFVEGAESASASLIPVLQQSMMARVAYYLVYSALIVVLLQVMNWFVQSRLHPQKSKDAVASSP